jgi:hypothetical protein
MGGSVGGFGSIMDQANRPRSFLDPSLSAGLDVAGGYDPLQHTRDLIGSIQQFASAGDPRVMTSRSDPAVGSAGGPRYASPSSMGSMIFAMPQDDLSDLQMRLFAAGFHNGPFDAIEFGTADPATYASWERFLNFAAQWNDPQFSEDGEAAHWQKPWWEILDELAGTEGALERFGGGGGGGGRAVPVRLTDPTAIRAVFEQASQATLGRRLSVEDERRFVGLIHNMERTAAHSAAAGGTYAQPAIDARAMEFAREEDPELAGAYDHVGQYGNLLSVILGGS